MNSPEKQEVIQNLKDADCDEDEITDILDSLGAGQRAEGIKKLKRHRSVLMKEIHIQQKKIDCLDFLIYQLGRK